MTQKQIEEAAVDEFIDRLLVCLESRGIDGTNWDGEDAANLIADGIKAAVDAEREGGWYDGMTDAAKIANTIITAPGVAKAILDIRDGKIKTGQAGGDYVGNADLLSS